MSYGGGGVVKEVTTVDIDVETILPKLQIRNKCATKPATLYIDNRSSTCHVVCLRGKIYDRLPGHHYARSLEFS